MPSSGHWGRLEIFKLMVPRCYGGLELDLDTFFEVGMALGEGDASMAWVANFSIEHNWILCQFPASFQQEFFAQRSCEGPSNMGISDRRAYGLT
jgi:alkylation response protein AidB-like acyl-CoA dehydrogenase